MSCIETYTFVPCGVERQICPEHRPVVSSIEILLGFLFYNYATMDIGSLQQIINSLYMDGEVSGTDNGLFTRVRGWIVYSQRLFTDQLHAAYPLRCVGSCSLGNSAPHDGG